MPALGVKQMAQINTQRIQKKRDLESLIEQAFNLTNHDQMEQLKKYIDHFEFSVHKMNTFHAMSEMMTFWGGSWIWALLLPIPEAVGTLLNYSFLVSLTGWTLEIASMTDFFEELETMQTLYNWVMKRGQLNYHPALDNDTKLANPDIIRMTELLAPLSTAEFMVAWKKVSHHKEETTPSLLTYCTNVYQSGLSFFKPVDPVAQSMENRLLHLKTRIEKEQTTVSVVDSLKRAGSYFSTHSYVQDRVKSDLWYFFQQPLQGFKNALPEILSSLASAEAENETHQHAC